MTLYYNFAGQQISQNQEVVLDPNCNGITIINTGATLATVNQVPLNAGVPGTSNGESLSIGGNQCEILKGRVTVNFPSGSGSVIVIQKFYHQTC